MKDRSELKKGDIVLDVPNDIYSRDTSIYDMQVVSIGPKYITAATIWKDGSLSGGQKYNNDEWMCLKEWASRKLFLGTREEYEVSKKEEAEAREICRETINKIGYSIGLEKLRLIKNIVETDDLRETLVDYLHNDQLKDIHGFLETTATKKCGQCGYFMRYKGNNGKGEKIGDCCNIEMNKECNDGINPFYHDGEPIKGGFVSILQVDENEDACGLFRKGTTKRVKKYIEEHSSQYTV